MSTPTVGIIGNGFIGGAIYKGFSPITEVKIHDKDPLRNAHTLEEVIDQDVIFLCIPTPMVKETGQCSTKNLLGVLNGVIGHSKFDQSKTVVIKSTIPPDFFQSLTNPQIVYMPEFLTERTAELDFLQSSRFIFGVSDGITTPKDVTRLFYTRFPGARQVVVSWETASMIKYATNNFFTVKLSFFNELSRICEELPPVDRKAVVEELLQDGRIGRSHFAVPGPDGQRGWGGHCFPKDNRALSYFARQLGLSTQMIDAAWKVNLECRGEEELEEELDQMKGRAVE